jgi:hypothetical protein
MYISKNYFKAHTHTQKPTKQIKTTTTKPTDIRVPILQLTEHSGHSRKLVRPSPSQAPPCVSSLSTIPALFHIPLLFVLSCLEGFSLSSFTICMAVFLSNPPHAFLNSGEMLVLFLDHVGIESLFFCDLLFPVHC